MREKRIVTVVQTLAPGITPAYAGKTVFFEEQVRFDEDHPRVCGKNYMQGELDFSSAGSPPRMREKRPLMALGRELNRITPAYAGKTKSSLLNLVVVQDHPRVCGKNHFKSLISNLVAGSPPRMREKLTRKAIVSVRTRITPAYAGKTSVMSLKTQWEQDHPRVCGKNTKRSQ